MKKLIATFLLLLVLILINSEAFACSCMGTEKPSTAFRKTPVIFVGTVKSVNSADSREFGDEFNFNDLRTTFSVDEAFKGVKKDEIDIYTSSQGTACGINFEEGEKILVYAYGGDKDRKYYSTSICTRTRPAENKDDEIAVLRSLSNGKFEPRIYGRLEEIVRSIFLGDYTDNEPMPGIKIIARSGRNIYKSNTDENGRFRFVNVKPGNYTLDVKLPETHKLGDDSWGFIEKQKVDLSFTVTDQDSPDFITIEARVDGRIKGRVYDFRGDPVKKGVHVTLVTKETVSNSDDKIEYIGVDTNNKGFYEFEGIPEGEYYLGINLDLSQPYKDNPYPKTFYPNVSVPEQSTSIRLAYGQKVEGYDLTLPKPLETKTVRGRVLKKNGQPIAGITVYVSNQARHNFEDHHSVKTDKNGEFLTDCLFSLEYRFAIYGEDSKGYSKKLAEKTLKVDENVNSQLQFILEN